jgi:hypothetical protein
MQAPPSPAAATAAAASSLINSITPQLTLVFQNVFVAEKPLKGSLGSKLAGLCQRPDKAAAVDGQNQQLQQKKGSAAAAAAAGSGPDMDAAAAAVGATFIVPGVSGRFVHSQLHAVMGPSGW